MRGCNGRAQGGPKDAVGEHQGGADGEIQNGKQAVVESGAAQEDAAAHHDGDEAPGLAREEAEVPSGAALADASDGFSGDPVEDHAGFEDAEDGGEGEELQRPVFVVEVADPTYEENAGTNEPHNSGGGELGMHASLGEASGAGQRCGGGGRHDAAGVMAPNRPGAKGGAIGQRR